MKDQPMKHLRIMMHRHMDCDRMTFALFLVYPFLSFSHPWPPVSEDGWMLFDSEIWAVAAAGQQFRNYIFSIAAPLFVFGTSGDGIPASWAGAQNHKFVRTENAIFKNGCLIRHHLTTTIHGQQAIHIIISSLLSFLGLQYIAIFISKICVVSLNYNWNASHPTKWCKRVPCQSLKSQKALLRP